MSNIVNLPTYEQSEQIKTGMLQTKQGVENVEIAIGNVENAVGNIQTIVESSGGTDWSKYKPFSVQPTINVQQIEANPITVFEATGEGYLSVAVVAGNAGGNVVRITLDGTKVLEVSSSNQSALTGFLLQEYIFTNSSSTISFQGGNGAAVPILVNRAQFAPAVQEERIFVSSQRLFFNSSIKVEVVKRGNSWSGMLYPVVAGGVAL